MENQLIASQFKIPQSSANSSKQQLITQERGGETREFEIPLPETNLQENQPIPIEKSEVIEVIADRQEYDSQRQVITAEGNVVMRFAQSTMTGDRLEVNLADRIAVAQGNVVLTRGKQVLRGEKFEYYLVQDRGVIVNANGEIDRSQLAQDLAPQLPSDPTVPQGALNDRLAGNQPLRDLTATDGIDITIGSGRDAEILPRTPSQSGQLNKLRFQAERIDFEPQTWTATNLRLTNDPFSPPELEVRAKTARFVQLDADVSRLETSGSRVVIDDSVTLPFLRNNFTFDNRPQRPGLFTVGFDGDERGGLFIERSFDLISRENTQWTVTPQYFLQRALIPSTFDFSDEDDGGIFDLAVFGVRSIFQTNLSPRTDVNANVSISSFDADDFEDLTRVRVSARQLIGNLNNPHAVSVEYNFNERLFNGSLGFQTVESSVGGVFTSPRIAIGKTGINLQYQGSIQNINAETDFDDFGAIGDEEVVNLTRYQVAAFLDKGFTLWQGKPLPPTREEGLRYSPTPVVPFLQLVTGVSGVANLYSSDDDQISLRGTVGLRGQLGKFSRSYLDSTEFDVIYSQSILTGESPFLFDREVDQQTISLGVNQQIYGPFRFGVRTSWSLDNDDAISTDYIIEYSRRTHNIILRYNPVLEVGSVGLRINDFNWRGNAEPLEQNNIDPVIQGVSR